MPHMPRQCEPELMDDPAEARAYAQADFHEPNQAFVDRLLQLTAGLEAAAALELGTGPGDIPVRVLRRHPGWQVTAVDASEAMLELARPVVERAGLADRLRLLQADAKATALPAASFDVIFSNSILHHLPEPGPLWAEIRRVGRPGAVVFLRDLARPRSEKHARDLVNHYAMHESPLLQQEFYRSLLAAFTVGEVRRQLEQAGLELQVEMVTDRHLDVFGRLGPG